MQTIFKILAVTFITFGIFPMNVVGQDVFGTKFAINGSSQNPSVTWSPEWNFNCSGNLTYSWQAVITDNTGNPVPPGPYNMQYCYYEDPAGSILIGCCNIVITVASIQNNKESGNAALSSFANALLAYPVPFDEDTAKKSIVDPGIYNYPDLYLGLSIEGEPISPFTKIASVPSAGASRRVFGDIFTQPGRLIVPGPAGSNYSRVELLATDSKSQILIIDSIGDINLTIDNQGILFSDGSRQTSNTIESGIAQAIGATGIVIDTNQTTLISMVLSAPAAGYVLAIASCQARAEHVNGSTSSINFGLKFTDGPTPSDADKEWQLPSALPSGQYETVISVQRIFPVVAGDTSFSFIAQNISIIPPDPHAAFDIALSLMFFPESYGTVQTVAREENDREGDHLEAPLRSKED